MSSKKYSNPFKPASDNFDFNRYPFYWVMCLGNRYTQKMEHQLKQRNINITTWRIGLILKELGAISISEVANRAVGRLPTITKSVYKMESQGLVTVYPNKNDGRVTMIEITEKGAILVNQVIKDTEKTIDLALKGLHKKEIETMNQLLIKVFNNLSN